MKCRYPSRRIFVNNNKPKYQNKMKTKLHIHLAESVSTTILLKTKIKLIILYFNL